MHIFNYTTRTKQYNLQYQTFLEILQLEAANLSLNPYRSIKLTSTFPEQIFTNNLAFISFFN